MYILNNGIMFIYKKERTTNNEKKCYYKVHKKNI